MNISSNGIRPLAMLNRFLNLVEDHIELAHLEFRYEEGQFERRLAIMALKAVCALGALIFIQIAAILGLMKLGIPLYAVCLLFAVLYAALGMVIHRRLVKRDPRAGEPFQTSKEELSRSLQWIHRLLS